MVDNKQKMKDVYRFENGMCMVFDQDGKQMPDYQGRWEEKKFEIIKDLPDNAVIHKTQEWVVS